MLKIGITGQAGFIGFHLFNTIGLYPGKFERIPFEDAFFENESNLNAFVKQCDTIVHLAAMNRHNDPEVLYQTNISLVKKIISACENTNAKPHIIQSSSTQEERANPYGRSKKEGRELFEQWAVKNQARFTGLIIPNVFGPFGNPYYNSVVATFCHQLTHNEVPVIEVDNTIQLIYVGELVKFIVNKVLENNRVENHIKVPDFERIEIHQTKEIKVSGLLEKLKGYHENYFFKGFIPDLNISFERELFFTYLSYIDHASFFPFSLKRNTDNRGSFIEIIRPESGGQVSFSTTVPGITRGNHFHTRKVERFAVIKGKARIELRQIGSGQVFSFTLDGNDPSFVDMPVWFTHNITNTGDEDLYTIFWINEHFDSENPDTYFAEV